MTNDKALKLALEALEYASTGNRRPEIIGPAITAIKAALAQPEQDLIPKEDLFVCGQMDAHVTRVYAKPEQESKSTIRALTEQCAALVWERDEFKKQVQQYEKNGVTCQTYRHKVEQPCAECNVSESYTTPPKREWVGLTDEEIDYLYVEHRGDGGPTAICEQFAKAYEAYLKEKNK